MNMKNKIKYRTASIVLGILSLVSFGLGIGSFFVFCTLGEGRQEEAIYSVSAFGTLFFLFLFLILGILFVIFSILKKKSMKKYEKENGYTMIEEEKELMKSEDAPLSEEHQALYAYSDDKTTNFTSLFKGTYYSSPVSFYVLMSCMIASYFLILVPLKTSLSGTTDWVCVSLIIVLFTYLFFFVFFILPLCTIHNAKKIKKLSSVYVYEDKIVIVNKAEKEESTQATNVTTSIVIFYDKMKKGRKDKSSYYFTYLNEKGRPSCLILSYREIEGFPISFFDDKLNALNHR